MSRIHTLVALFALVILAATTPAQKKLSDGDIKSLKKSFPEAMQNVSSGGPALIADALKKLGHDDGDGNVDPAILGDVEGWQKLLDGYYVTSLGKKKPSGAGRIATETINIPRRGDTLQLEYSYLIPKKYNHNKAWPLVLCFHDGMEKGNGKGYLKEIWQARGSKGLADDFILVAPHIGAESLSGRIKGTRENAKPFTFDWFTTEHALAMLKPLIEIRQKLNVDPDRIFVTGTGQGAEIALQLGALYGVETFSGVVARHGQPRDLKYIEGLRNVPTLFLYREGGEYDQGDKKAYWDRIRSTAKEKGIETISFETLPAMEKLQRKHLAGQKTDPLLDAQPKVVEFLKAQKGKSYPTKLHIVTDNGAFLKKSFAKLTKVDLKPGKFIECKVEVDREKNAIMVEGKDFYGLTLFLNDSIVDLGKPVELFVNGEMVKREQVQRSLTRMMGYMRRPFLGRVWSAFMTAEIVAKKEEEGDNEDAEEGN